MKKILRCATVIVTLAIVICLIQPVAINAASYPLISATLESAVTIPEGETGVFRFMVLPEYKNEQYHVEVYNSAGQKIAVAESTYYNSSVYIRYFNISLDTDELDMGTGTYTVKYWLSFYTMYNWHDAPNKYTHTFKVIKNTCKGNHNLVIERVVTEGSCEDEGTVKKQCTKCDYEVYVSELGDHVYGSWSGLDNTQHQRVCSECGAAEKQNHNWDSGKITKQPTCAETGVKTYTCSDCGTTKQETIATNDEHVYGEWNKIDNTNHEKICTLCGKAERQSHRWDAGVITTQPTCAKTGVKTYTCTVCNGTKTQTVPKTTEHVYGPYTVVDDNTHAHTCTVCSKTESAAHIWDAGTIILMPTQTTTGLREHHCTQCSDTETVIVPRRSSGDLDGDLQVNNKDVEYLLWHTLFPESYPLELSADFDLDGFVNNKDVEYLLWHTLFPESYPI